MYLKGCLAYHHWHCDACEDIMENSNISCSLCISNDDEKDFRSHNEFQGLFHIDSDLEKNKKPKVLSE
jgi:hypothetical protein